MDLKVPYRFRGLETIGVIFFLANICFYIAIWILLLCRFYFYPYTFRASLYHPTESLFVPAAVVSFGTILINISQYGLEHAGQWLNNVVHILFWIDATLAMFFSSGIYLLLYVRVAKNLSHHTDQSAAGPPNTFPSAR